MVQPGTSPEEFLRTSSPDSVIGEIYQKSIVEEGEDAFFDSFPDAVDKIRADPSKMAMATEVTNLCHAKPVEYVCRPALNLS